MKTDVDYMLACFIAAAALIVAVSSGNPWAGLIPSVLFIFVWFPRWRNKMYEFSKAAISRITGKNDNGCDGNN